MTPLPLDLLYLTLTGEQLDRAVRDYDVERLALIDHVLQPGPWEPAARALLDAHGVRIDRPAVPDAPRLDPATLDFGEAYRHTLVEAEPILAALPVVRGLNADVIAVAEAVTQRKCIASPYPRSAVTLKHYGPGDVQGFHLDTNPLSILVALTDCPVGGELIVHTFDGGRRVIRMAAGDVLIFDGRSMPHVVQRQPDGADRILLSFNTYYPEDTWRPAAIDDVMFES